MSLAGPGGRFLILSASRGSGHDAVAGEIATRLAAAGHDVARADVLSLLPAGLGPALRTFYHAVIGHAPALYEGIYAAFFRGSPAFSDGRVPRPGSTPLAALAGDRLLALTARTGPTSSCRSFTSPLRSPGGSAPAGRCRCPAPWW